MVSAEGDGLCTVVDDEVERVARRGVCIERVAVFDGESVSHGKAQSAAEAAVGFDKDIGPYGVVEPVAQTDFNRWGGIVLSVDYFSRKEDVFGLCPSDV